MAARNGGDPLSRKDIETIVRSIVVEVVGASEQRLTEMMRGIETNLLTEFHRYAKGQQARMHKLEVADHDTDLRLHTIEERLLELERRIRPDRIT